MGIVIAIVLAVAVAIVVVVLLMSRRGSDSSGAATGTPSTDSGRMRPAVAEFHVIDGSARVHFEVPLPAGGADEVLAELLGREAVEVVREKRHTLPLGDIHRVVALGRASGSWKEVATIGLDTPGELPPPVPVVPLAHGGHHDFDPFERMSDLPQQAPGLAGGTRSEDLGPLTLRLPAAALAGLRAQGIDPAQADAVAQVLGLMRAAGYTLMPQGADSYRADRAGVATFVRTVAHARGSHPELDEAAIRRFVVDFAASGAARGLLLSEKFAPFEIYDRERRDPRVRFVSRERLQAFADALALG